MLKTPSFSIKINWMVLNSILFLDHFIGVKRLNIDLPFGLADGFYCSDLVDNLILLRELE